MKSEYNAERLLEQRRIIAEQQETISALRHELAVERFRRLTLEIDKAVRAGDREAWAAAVRERMSIGIDFVEVEIAMERKAVR